VSSDSSDDEEWSGNSTAGKGNEEPSDAETNLSAGKSSRIRAASHSDELTPQRGQKRLHSDSLHGSADQNYSGDLEPNSSNSTTRKGKFGSIIYQESLVQESFRQ
jgi:hypothetical protein